jgi:hypothetical protein
MIFMSPSCGTRCGNWVRVSMVIQRNSHEPLESPAEIDPNRSVVGVRFLVSENSIPFNTQRTTLRVGSKIN